MVKNMTALMIAAWQGNIKIVKDLIEAGADVNARLSDGSTALILATEQGHSECVGVLVKAGADVNITADINLPDLHCIKNVNEEGGKEQRMGMTSNQMGPNRNAVDDLPARNEDKTSNNGGIQAAVPNPTPRNVNKLDVQEILKNDGNDDNNHKNERNLGDHNNASSVKRADHSHPPGQLWRFPIIHKKAPLPPGRRVCTQTNRTIAPSPENRVGCSVGEDFGNEGIVPSVGPAGKPAAIEKAIKIATAMRKNLTITPEVQKSLTNNCEKLEHYLQRSGNIQE